MRETAARGLRERASYRIVVIFVLFGLCILGILVSVGIGPLRIGIGQVIGRCLSNRKTLTGRLSGEYGCPEP